MFETKNTARVPNCVERTVVSDRNHRRLSTTMADFIEYRSVRLGDIELVSTLHSRASVCLRMLVDKLNQLFSVYSVYLLVQRTILTDK